MNCVVKEKEISNFLCSFYDLIKSSKIRSIAGIHVGDFTRIRKFPWYDLILYLIFRHCSTTNQELTEYFTGKSDIDNRISKQALFKAVEKLNPNVFRHLFKCFALSFYQSQLVKYFKGYILLSEDGTTLETPRTDASVRENGYVINQYIRDEDDVHKVISASSGLYDVMNGFYLDFMIRPFAYPEPALAVQHLQTTQDALRGKK